MRKSFKFAFAKVASSEKKLFSKIIPFTIETISSKLLINLTQNTWARWIPKKYYHNLSIFGKDWIFNPTPGWERVLRYAEGRARFSISNLPKTISGAKRKVVCGQSSTNTWADLQPKASLSNSTLISTLATNGQKTKQQQARESKRRVSCTVKEGCYWVNKLSV